MGIDGSIMEGGGQILRISSALSAILGIPIKICNIRAGRSTPGLRPQHVTSLKLMRDLCDATLDGDYVGSTEIVFSPGRIIGGEFSVDTKTAGIITLMIQAILPCLLFAMKGSKIVMKGGTNVDFSPPIDYLLKVFSPAAKLFGIQFDCKLIRRGFFPKGGGEVHLSASPVRTLTPAVADKPQTVKQIEGVAFVSGTIPIHVTLTQSQSFYSYPHVSVAQVAQKICESAMSKL